MNSADLEILARRLRGTLIDLSHQTKTAHLGSCLSCLDILIAFYWGFLAIDPADPRHPHRDRLIFSKGHAAMALYAVLAHKGFFPPEWLSQLNQPGSLMWEHPVYGTLPGVEVTAGSLGHGLPMGAGLALAAKIQGQPQRVAVVMSDGECNEGSVWEAAMFAPARGLDNLMVVVDYNKWQATGRSNEVLALAPLADKWRAFGWQAYEVDGHNLTELLALLEALPVGGGKPVAVVAHTVKGRGVSFMEDDNNWHYRIPSADEVQRAKQELGLV